MNVYKTYSGKMGCMCGCLGNYAYTQYGANAHSPGYKPNINERSVKIIAGKLLRNNNTKQEDNMLILEQNGRIMVAWFE